MTDDYETHELEMAFQAGTASRDAEVAELREQVTLLRESIQDAADRLRNTNSWIWEDLIQALAATEPHGRS